MVSYTMNSLFSGGFAVHYKRKDILLEIVLSGNFLWSHTEEALAYTTTLCLGQLEGTKKKGVYWGRRQEACIFIAWPFFITSGVMDQFNMLIWLRFKPQLFNQTFWVLL